MSLIIIVLFVLCSGDGDGDGDDEIKTLKGKKCSRGLHGLSPYKLVSMIYTSLKGLPVRGHCVAIFPYRACAEDSYATH